MRRVAEYAGQTGELVKFKSATRRDPRNSKAAPLAPTEWPDLVRMPGWIHSKRFTKFAEHTSSMKRVVCQQIPADVPMRIGLRPES